MPQPKTPRSLFRLLAFLLLCSGNSFAGRPADPDRSWQGIPGLERTAKGRVFSSWFSGGPKEPAPENVVLLCWSDDGAKSFTEPQVMAEPKDGTRCFDPTLWIDPGGRLWYVFNRGNKDTARHDVWARICDDPDAGTPEFGAEFRVGFDEVPFSFRMNKPTVLSSGEWVMPVTHADQPSHDWFPFADQLQGVGISRDEGKSWKLQGALSAPKWALECMITELKDGRLWLLTRTGSGFLWESHSSDKGLTWSKPNATRISNPGSRFFIRRLASGNLLLVNHYKFKGRSHLYAQISTNDGQKWNEGLLLDERSGISYPDGVQDKDGLIWITYDRDRQGAGEILLAKFEEEDVLAGKNVSGKLLLKQTINKLNKPSLVPAHWDPALAGDEVMSGLVAVTAPQVKGAHDAEMVIVGERAYVVAEVNDVRAGESAGWPEIYATLSIVRLNPPGLEVVIPIAKGEQAFENETLPVGACFVPRILQKDDKTLRCYFTSEDPGKRQSQMWYRDFDLEAGVFAPTIHRANLKTAAGTFDFQPQYFHADAVAQGFTKPAVDSSFFLFDSFKRFDGKLHVAINNFTGKQNALALVHDDLATFEVLGHYNEPQSQELSESAVNRLPDGTWMAICRNDAGNYHFTTSPDGRTWTEGREMPFVQNGGNSKPTFDKFGDLYYLGWQEKTQIHGVSRSVFNVDVSRDGKTWERKYRFESTKSFQYPTFREHEGMIWLCATQGDTSSSRKERIMFGKLETVGEFANQSGKTRKPIPMPPVEKAVMKTGVKLFTDREYALDEMPSEVAGLSFLRTSIAETDVIVKKGGLLYALTPTVRPQAASQEEALKAAGFAKVDVPEVQFFPGEINRVSLYRKQVAAGDRLRFNKLALLVMGEGTEIEERGAIAAKPWAENDGERLYNGIVLPKIWPPEHLQSKSDDPMPVPYLQDPPKVIPIDLGRQLFVDDFLIESTDLKRVFHQAEKYEGNPVFRPETEEELKRNDVVYLGQGGVFYDPAEKLFKMFYTAGWRGALAMATSPDLKTWTRPGLGLHGGNIVLPEGTAWGEGKGDTAGGDNALWYDVTAKDPAERIKYLTCWSHTTKDKLVPGLTHSLQVSDGVNWSRPVPCNVTMADYGSIFYNPFRQRWVQSIKKDTSRGRSRYYVESENFLEGADWTNAVYWTNADRLDLPELATNYPGGGEATQLYSLAAVAYESVMVGMHQILRGPDNEICHKGGFPKLTDLELGFSRDGFHWHRPDRRGFIRGERKEGAWDRAYLHTTTGVFVVLDDRLVFPYCAYSGDAGEGRRDMYGGASIGLASLRRDGFASMEGAGTLTTRPVSFSGEHFYVNMVGKLSVEVIDEAGTILRSSQVVSGDSTKLKIEWSDPSDMSNFAGKPVRFRFHLDEGSLYSFWVSNDPGGGSGGYLGAGGPEFAGLRDIPAPDPQAQETKERTDALLPPKVHTAPVPVRYLDENRMFLCGPGITASPGGRLWVTFKTGDIGEDEDNCTVVVTSGDKGETWSKPVLAVDIDGPVRTNDPGIWTDPNGKVTLMFGQVYGFWDGRGGLWTMTAENGDEENTKWSEPVRLGDGYTKNKPFITKDGKWLYLIEHMGPKGWRGRYAKGAPMDPGFIHPRPELNHANVFVSEDEGKTLRYLGQSKVPAKDKTFQEHMIVGKKDGTLWMLGRTTYGVGEAFSKDQGKTWTEMAPAKGIAGPSSRTFFQRLKSGNILLIKNGNEINQPSGRTHMTAYLSEDDGATWPYKLLLDERATSYPDAAEDKEGVLHIVHDFERHGAKIVCYHRITEADIKAGKLVKKGSALGRIANQATHSNLKPEEYEKWRGRQ